MNESSLLILVITVLTLALLTAARFRLVLWSYLFLFIPGYHLFMEYYVRANPVTDADLQIGRAHV